MPKKSKKSKSKRTTLKQKYKVIKKVKEHHKKKAKLAKKSGRKVKAPKDPGIPSQWPFKQELVKELEWEKQRALAEQQRKREERRLARVRYYDALLTTMSSSTALGCSSFQPLGPCTTSQLWSRLRRAVGAAVIVHCTHLTSLVRLASTGTMGRSVVQKRSSSRGPMRTWQPP